MDPLKLSGERKVTSLGEITGSSARLVRYRFKGAKAYPQTGYA
jgi:hypothetical protein